MERPCLKQHLYNSKVSFVFCVVASGFNKCISVVKDCILIVYMYVRINACNSPVFSVNTNKH